MWQLASGFQYLEAAQVWHHDVEQNNVDRFVGLDPIKCGAAVRDQCDTIRSGFQLHLDDAADVRLVVRDQHVAGALPGAILECHGSKITPELGFRPALPMGLTQAGFEAYGSYYL